MYRFNSGSCADSEFTHSLRILSLTKSELRFIFPRHINFHVHIKKISACLRRRFFINLFLTWKGKANDRYCVK